MDLEVISLVDLALESPRAPKIDDVQSNDTGKRGKPILQKLSFTRSKDLVQALVPLEEVESSTQNDAPQEKKSIQLPSFDKGKSYVPLERRKPTKYIPFFTVLSTLALGAILGVEIYYNGGLESYQNNPYFGPSTETLIAFGALDGQLMWGDKQYYR